MNKEEFEKFLQQKTLEAKPSVEVNWEAKKATWLKRLAEFYSDVDKYLGEYVQSGKIKLETKSISLNEDYIGQYQADSKYISIGSSLVTLKPIGTLLIGAAGRVDMVGPAGAVKFILTGKDSDGMRISITYGGGKPAAPPAKIAPEDYVWKIATPPPRVRFIEVNLETFLNALTEVVNG
jgi:hypothetical protein